jgi:hypothetical protein
MFNHLDCRRMRLKALNCRVVHPLRVGLDDYGGHVVSARVVGIFLLHLLDASGDGVSYAYPLSLGCDGREHTESGD